MRRVRRHLAAGAVLVLAAVLTCAHVLGEPARDPSGKIRFGGSKPVTRDTGLDLYAELNTKLTHAGNDKVLPEQIVVLSLLTSISALIGKR